MPKSIITVVSWLCFLGAATLAASLFLGTDFKAPNPETLQIVRVSRDQLERSVEAAVAESPKLKNESEKLSNEMQKGAEAQSLLVAEAFRQGLAESDYIVRNRLAEMQVMALYEIADAQVTPDAVNTYFNENRKRYVRRPKRKYIHLFVPITNQVDSGTAKHLLDTLFNSSDFDEKNKWVTQDELRQSWGPKLAKQVFEMPLNKWSEPIYTKSGWHRIKVLGEAPERLYEFEEIQTRVTEDFRRHIRKKIYDTEIARLKKIYKIKWID